MSEFASLDLRIRNNQFNSGVDSSMSKLNGLSGVATMAGTAIAGIFALKRGASLAKSLLDMSADAEEIRSKYSVVFRDMSKGAEQIANDFAKNFDLAGSSARRLLADTGDLLTGFGFTQEQALMLAEKTNSLAGDLASFTNIEGGTAKASQALTKALVGETEQAKALGIVIRQNSKEFQDSVKYYMESQGATILQAKALTALDIAVKQSQNAIGDYQRTRESEANATRAVSESYKQLQETLGATISEGINYSEILKLTGGILEETAKWINSLDQSTKNFLVRSGALTIAIGVSVIAYKSLRTAIQLKNAVLQQGTALTNDNTKSTLVNAGAQKTLASSFSSVSKGLGAIGLIGASAFVGWEIGRTINELTGLDQVLANVYGRMFHGQGQAEAKGKDLDRQLAELNKKDPLNQSGRKANLSGSSGIEQTVKLTKAQLKDQEEINRAQKRFDEAIFDNKLDQAKIEEKINLLYDKRTKLANEALNAENQAESIDLWTEKLRVENQIANLQKSKREQDTKAEQERAKALAEFNKPILENTLVDAIEKGSMEALKLESRQVTTTDKAPEATAKNTKIIADEMKKLNRNSGGSNRVNISVVSAI